MTAGNNRDKLEVFMKILTLQSSEVRTGYESEANEL